MFSSVEEANCLLSVEKQLEPVLIETPFFDWDNKENNLAETRKKEKSVGARELRREIELMSLFYVDSGKISRPSSNGKESVSCLILSVTLWTE